MKRKVQKVLSALLCAALLAAVMPLARTHAESALATGYVNSATLNMRNGAGTGNTIVDTLTRNTAVNIYEVSGSWLRIDVPSTGKAGYVYGKYISIDSSSLSAYALGVTTGKVHLRKEATSKSDSIAIVESNLGVTIYSADGTTGWYKVKVHATSQEGYISPTYVKVVCKVSGASSASGTAGYINAAQVNFRTGPSTGYTSQGKLDKYTALTVTGTNGNWYKATLTSTGKSGYVYKTYVTIGTTSATPTPVVTSGSSGYIKATQVNFRTGPSTSYSSQGKLDKNTALTVTGTSGNWYQVTLSSSGKSGYVYKTYVTIGTTSVTPTPVITNGTAGYINASGVNFRTGPSTRYTSQGKLDKNTALTVTATSGNWYQVTLSSSGKSGYVYKTYVTLGAAATPTPAPASGAPGYINASGVNFRTGPSTSYKSNGKLDKNTALTLLGISGSWYKVKITSTGKNGYVFAKYVTLTAATPTPSPSNTPTPTPSATPSPSYVIITPSPSPSDTPTPSPAVTTPAVTTPAAATPAAATPAATTPDATTPDSGE